MQKLDTVHSRIEILAQIRLLLQQYGKKLLNMNFHNPKRNLVEMIDVTGNAELFKNVIEKFILMDEIAKTSTIAQDVIFDRSKLDRVLEQFVSGQYFLLVSNKKQDILGTCGLIINEDGNVEMVIYMLQDARRDGVASQACLKLEEWAFFNNIKEIHFKAFSDNPSVNIITALGAKHVKNLGNNRSEFSVNIGDFKQNENIIRGNISKSLHQITSKL